MASKLEREFASLSDNAFVRAYYSVGTGTKVDIVDDRLIVELPAGRRFEAGIKMLDFDKIESTLDASGRLYLYAGQFLTQIDADDASGQKVIAPVCLSETG